MYNNGGDCNAGGNITLCGTGTAWDSTIKRCKWDSTEASAYDPSHDFDEFTLDDFSQDENVAAAAEEPAAEEPVAAAAEEPVSAAIDDDVTDDGCDGDNCETNVVVNVGTILTLSAGTVSGATTEDAAKADVARAVLDNTGPQNEIAKYVATACIPSKQLGLLY